jgi:hypothetical protein
VRTTQAERDRERIMNPKRLAYVFPQDPPSRAIADALNALGARVCGHGRCPCIALCGVDRVGIPSTRMDWVPLTSERRAQWFGRFYGLLVRNAEEHP